MRLKLAPEVMLTLLILCLPVFSVVPVFASPAEWVSPTGHEESGWNPETNAYDDNMESYAFYEVYGNSWSPWLVLTHAGITSTKLRLKTGGASNSQQEAYVDGQWRSATYEGSSEGFGNYTFDGGILTKVRIKLFGLGGGYHRLYVYEVDILDSTTVPPFVESCDSTRHFIYDSYGWVNVTVHDDSGLSHLKTVDINVATESCSEEFCLRWTQSTDLISEVDDNKGICQLDSTTSTIVDLGNDYYRIAYYFRICSNATSGYADVTAALIDDDNNTDSKSYVEEFWVGKYYAIEDTYIGDGSGGGGNHGTETSMKVGYDYPLYHYEGQSQIWLQFDLISLDKGTVVENVSLNLYFIRATYQEMEVRLRGHDNMTWSETGITWTSPPTGNFYENVLGYYRGPDSSGSAGWWQFSDTTTESYEPSYPFEGGPWTGYLDSYLNHVLAQDTRKATFCLDITGYDGAGGYYNFRTKEWGTPYLSIESTWVQPSEYNLTVCSLPTDVSFKVDNVSHAAPWLGIYGENTSVSLIMPRIHTVGDAQYYWNQWSDGNTSNTITITMTSNLTLTGQYTGPYYELTVGSSPIVGVAFTVNYIPQTTLYNEWLLAGSYMLEMPEIHTVGDARYHWNQWDDGKTSRSRIITISENTSLTAHYSGPYYELTVNSSPITGLTFTIHGVPETTPYTEWLLGDSYTLIMPETYNGWVWSHWLEDGNTSSIRTISLPPTTYTAIYITPPIGGTAISIKPGHLSSWIASVFLVISAVFALSTYIRHQKSKTSVNKCKHER